ncbi:hypothetical protein [Labedaea rhizosphaerae]|uniref:Uncharacterized protein n=1 Tax=Labedaea rhizosphaerae TaxID=598644 RepID=A0A4R6SB37_LABRH|nr:hypothetical protein [Labedaea rhizosphaerae]TDP97259.1 hypothetical protein EV186_103222 [Labedaea rhizosphaerae]
MTTLTILLLVLAITLLALRHTRPEGGWPGAHDVEDRDADRMRMELRARY